jgi:hypothetical protein
MHPKSKLISAQTSDINAKYRIIGTVAAAGS